MSNDSSGTHLGNAQPLTGGPVGTGMQLSKVARKESFDSVNTGSQKNCMNPSLLAPLLDEDCCRPGHTMKREN